MSDPIVAPKPVLGPCRPVGVVEVARAAAAPSVEGALGVHDLPETADARCNEEMFLSWQIATSSFLLLVVMASNLLAMAFYYFDAS